jgi:hypothetical protein
MSGKRKGLFGCLEIRKLLLSFGAGGRNRTDMDVKPGGF